MQSRTRRNARRITVVIGRIRLPARGCHFGAPWRLCVLPDFGKRNSALGGSQRCAGEHASGRRPTAIIADEEMYLSATSIVADVGGGHHRYVARFAKGNP